MFELVDDVDAYAEFLPWCDRSETLSRDGDTVEASMDLQKGGIKKSFTTRNKRIPGERIDIDLVGGPFRHLAGGWRFEPLSEEGSKVSLELDFEFDGRLADVMFGAFFEDTCNALVDAFVDRAGQVYGER